MSAKSYTIENILFVLFLVEFPIVFFLYKYPSFSDYDIQRAAFYFLLILTALFSILFAFFCCYDFLFAHPLFVKRAFMLFSIVFLPLFTKYVADNYYYAIYITPFVYIIACFCFSISSIHLPNEKIEKTPILNRVGDFFNTFFPVIYYLYKLPLVTYLGMKDSAFIFTLATIAVFFCPYWILLVNRPLLKNYQFLVNIYNIFCCFTAPFFVLYVYKNLLFEKYLRTIIIIVFATPVISRQLTKHLQKKLNDSQAENHSADSD